jgi:hypothetical protein
MHAYTIHVKLNLKFPIDSAPFRKHLLTKTILQKAMLSSEQDFTVALLVRFSYLKQEIRDGLNSFTWF